MTTTDDFKARLLARQADVLATDDITVDTRECVDALTDFVHEMVDEGYLLEDTPRGRRVESWDDWLYRFEQRYHVALPDQLDHPVIRRIKQLARDYINEQDRYS